MQRKEKKQKESKVEMKEINEEELTPSLITLISTCNVNLKRLLFFEIEQGNHENVSVLIDRIEKYNTFILNMFTYDETVKKQLGVTVEEVDSKENKIDKPTKPSKIDDIFIKQERLKV